MIHLVTNHQLIGRVTVEHPEEPRNVWKKDLTGSHKNCNVVNTLQHQASYSVSPRQIRIYYARVMELYK